MINLINRHGVLFFAFLFGILPIGIGIGPAALVLVPLLFGFLYYRQQFDSILLLLVLILVLGDSRQLWLGFVKSLRVEMIILIGLATLYDIWKGQYKFRTLYLGILPFLMISFLALFTFGVDMNTGIIKTISFALLYFVGLHYIWFVFQRYGIRMLGDVVYLSHLVLLVGLVMYPFAPDIVTYGGVRFNGLLGNPNGMGLFVTLVVPITVYYFTNTKEKVTNSYKVFAWFLIIISLVFCSSRNALLAFSLFWIFYYGLGGNNFTRFFFFFVLLPLVGLFFFNVDFEALLIDLSLGKYFRVKELRSGSGRIFAWEHAWTMIQKNPLIGCGFACEEYNFAFKPSIELWRTGHQGGVHNSYLAFIVNTGFIGFSFYLGFLASLLAKIRRWRFFFAYCILVLVSALFESWLFSSLSAFHIFFLMTVIFFIVEAEQEKLLMPEAIE